MGVSNMPSVARLQARLHPRLGLAVSILIDEPHHDQAGTSNLFSSSSTTTESRESCAWQNKT